jgi:hypothetical protein
MAMNEDSVVSSLNELRRMANERSRREAETRRVEAERQSAAHSARRSAASARNTRTLTEGYLEPKIHVDGYPENGGGQYEQQQPGNAPAGSYGGYGAGNGYAPAGYGGTATYGTQGGYQGAGYPDAQPVRRKSSAGAVLITIILMSGAAAGGYGKLRQDMQSTVRVHIAATEQAEQGKAKAVEAAAKAEQNAKVQIAALEARIKTLTAEKPSAAADNAPSAEPKKVAAAAPWSKKARARARAAARRARSSLATLPAAAPEEKKASLPKIAGKKKITDDPLAGLKM